MIDTHCHIYKEYYEDIDSLVNEIKASGVTKVIVNGCDMKSNLEVLELVSKYDIVYGALGFHPTELDNFSIEDLNWLEDHINDDKIVAIGEIGLDYHYEDTDKEIQKDVFFKQLEIASKYNKPVIVHSRDAIQDTYDMLSKFKIRGSIHSFSGSVEMANEFIKLGYYIGIGGVCTFKNAKNIINVIKNIQLSYILLETDAPYLTPEPYRGKKNTSAYIPIIAGKVAEIKGETLSKVCQMTTQNANSLFDF